MNDLTEITEQYMRQVNDFTELQMRDFLRKNAIPTGNIQSIREWLKDRGLRLYDEVKDDPIRHRKIHHLLLLKVMDEHKFSISDPTVGVRL